jgi:DNA-binding transcriptional ArsR family regulator
MHAEMRGDIFFAIGDPTRRKLLELVAFGDHSIAALCDNFEVSRNAIVKHLHVLKDAGLISIKRHGRERRCELRGEAMKEVMQWVEMFEPFWEEKLDALDSYLKELAEEDL